MRIHSFAFLALLGAAACGGDDAGDDTNTVAPTPNANAVIPANGFSGRQLRVQISGDNTAWDASTTVTMGDGITVGAITVASPTDIFAQITIASDAALGTRDVTVSDGTKLTQAFEIRSPLNVTYTGTLAQGSIGLFTIQNLDFENPFDTTTTGDGFFMPIVYTNIEVDGPSGTAFQFSTVEPFSISGTFLFDTDAASGAVVTKSGPVGGTIASSQEAISIAARTATALTGGTSATVLVAKGFDSSLYTYTGPAGTALNVVATSTTNTDATPQVFLLPASGKWADEIGAGPSVGAQSTAATQYYAVYLDASGTQGYQANLVAKSATALLAETEPNDTKAAAQTGKAAPFGFVGASGADATLTDVDDQDWIKVTVTANQKLHITTVGGDANCDTVVTVYKADGTTQVAVSDDLVYLDELTTGALAAGDYYVVISADQDGFFDDTVNHYNALIEVQ